MACRSRLLLLALCLIGGAAHAEGEPVAQTLCQRASKNQAIFEMQRTGAVARDGAEPGAVACTWTFDGGAYGPGTLVVELATHLLKSGRRPGWRS